MIENEPLYDNPKNPHTYKEEFISKGNDFEVYGFDEKHVVKIPHSDDSKNPEYYNDLLNDYTTMKEIFGDNLSDSYFISSEKTDNGTYRIIQPRFRQEEFLDSIPKEEFRGFILEHRKLFEDLLQKAKKAKEEFKVPVDLTIHNIVFHDGKLIITENDSPTARLKDRHFGEKIIKDSETIRLLENFHQRFKNITNFLGLNSNLFWSRGV